MDSAIAQHIVKHRAVAFAVTDSQLRIQRVGGQRALLPQWEPECIGKFLWDVVPEMIGHEPDLQEIVAGAIPRFELPLVNRDTDTGELCYVTLTNLPFTDMSVDAAHSANANINGVLHLVEDVTPLGEAEQFMIQQRNDMHLLYGQLKTQNLKLQAMNAELQELDEIKSRFVSVAAHELSNPIASASMYIELMMEGAFDELTETQMRTIQIVRSALERLQNITGNMLDVTRIETGRIELYLQPIDLAELVNDVVAELQPTLDVKQQLVDLHVAPDLPAALCDAMRAAQILNNLVNNASKYSPPATIIQIRVVQAKEEGFLQVSVTDQGIGIEPEDLAHLFERFFRATNARVSGSNGVGLGLSIVYSLVELHGGRVWVESVPNQGSTFYVTLPIDDSPDDDLIDDGLVAAA